MKKFLQNNKTVAGIILAIIAVIIWSGNFIVARDVIKQIPPVSLAFYRWLTAAVLITPIAINRAYQKKAILLANWKYLFWAALFGISIFNTLVYIAAHHTTAINLALIGTTSSPIFALILAAIFLKEKITVNRIAGVVFCLAGIVFLLSKGSFERLMHFHFSKGDLWVLGGAFTFAIYNILVRKKPADISPYGFLFSIFWIGTLLLIPFYWIESNQTPPIKWNSHLIWIILYLGLGTSVIAFLLWNAAIAKLGTARTALFGNLIPMLSTIEAIIILNEKFEWIHLISGILILIGLFIANTKFTKR